MIQLKALREMLDIKEDELKELDDEQLKLLLGCLHYTARIVTREVNDRESLADLADKE